MPFTRYGTERVDVEQAALVEKIASDPEGTRALRLGGASFHAYAVGINLGERYVLTGRDAYGRRMRREAGSIRAVDAIVRAAWGYKRAWHVREDGSRRLVFSR